LAGFVGGFSALAFLLLEGQAAPEISTMVSLYVDSSPAASSVLFPTGMTFLPVLLGWFFVYGSPVFVITCMILYGIYQMLRSRSEGKESKATALLKQAEYERHRQKSLAADPFAKWDRENRRKFPVPLPPNAERRYRIAVRGKDIGEHDVSEIKRMIDSREITMQDHYFDEDGNDWMPLDCLPDLV